MTDFVTINTARLGYRLCGPDGAPLIITLHGGRGMGTGHVLQALIFVEETNRAQGIIEQTSKHSVLWVTNGASSRLTTEVTGRVLAPSLTHSISWWTTLKASGNILPGKKTKL